jgi:hypothetical protein
LTDDEKYLYAIGEGNWQEMQGCYDHSQQEFKAIKANSTLQL